MISPRALAIASKLRAARFRKSAFNFAKAISIGFRSGEYGGRNSSQAPFALTSSSARGLLWKATLSRMTTLPFVIVGANWVSIQVSKMRLFIGLSTIQVATISKIEGQR